MDARGSQEDARPGETAHVRPSRRQGAGPLHRCGQVQGNGGGDPFPLHRPAGWSAEKARPQGEARQEEIRRPSKAPRTGVRGGFAFAMSFPDQFASKLPDVGTTIFTVMSRRAAEQGAVNVGQGFPDYPIDPRLADCVTEAVQAGFNQYAPMAGDVALRARIA